MPLNIPTNLAVKFFTEHIQGAQKSGSLLKGRCPVCGDSKNLSKKRLYLLNSPDRGWHLFCHNCDLSISLFNFVKTYFPTVFNSFKSECLSDYIYNNKKKEPKKDTTSKLLNKIKSKKKSREKVKKSKIEIFYEKHCVDLTEEILEDVKSRNISKDIIDKLKLCKTRDDDFRKYNGRLIIPFFDSDGKLFYFQARKTEEEQYGPKYINWDGLDKKPEYNEHFVDLDKRVYIVEGLFDSTFIDNSISTLGVKISQSKILYLEDKYSKCVYCLDNDPDGLFWTEKLLKKNRTCLVFPPKYKDFKDLNDIAVHENINNLTKFVEDNSYKGAMGLLKLKQLKRS